ncbi:MAG: hypothetical protein RQ839_08375 [Thermoproteus sp.]|nr:hypothetical protein [Thermoproteus sp.]MDT7882365.1 hypothetical protein [Thermoproteus sp.]
MDVEILKRALRELVEREPTFLRDLFLDALRADGRIAEALLDLFTKHPEAKLRLAQAVAESVAVPLNVATKEDLKQLATKQDIKRLEDQMATKEDLKQFATKDDLKQLATKQDLEQLKKWAEEKFATKQDLEQLKKWAEERFVTKEDLKQYAAKQDLETAVELLRAEIRRIENRMATKEQIESITISVEDSGREMAQYLLEQRGYRCAAERLRSDYEFDIYCNAGALTAVGEAKVRAGGRDVEKALERAQELLRRQPDKISGKLVPVFYTLVAEPTAAQKARELKIWLIESKREVVTLEEALGTDNKQ